MAEPVRNGARESFMVLFKKHPRAIEFADRFQSLVHNEAYRRHIDGLKKFQDGVDPIPNRDAHEHLLREVGHDFAATQVLRPGNLFRNLFASGPVREDYFALHGTIAARLLNGKSTMSQQKVQMLYDTRDRIFTGGGSWPEVTRVNAITDQDYRRLLRVRKPSGSPISVLNDIVEEAGKVEWGAAHGPFSIVGYSAILFIGFIIAAKNGRTRIDQDDCFEAAEAYLKLFETDLLSLPPLERHGASGYEL